MSAEFILKNCLVIGLVTVCVYLVKPVYAAEGPHNWKCAGLLDEQTANDLRRFEQFFAQLYEPPKQYSEEDVNRWINELSGQDFDAAAKAAACLGVFKTAQARKALENAATAEGGSNRVKWIAVRSLGLIGDKQSIPVLTGLLDHYNRNIQVYACVSLAEMTKVYFGTDKAKWQKWFEGQEDMTGTKVTKQQNTVEAGGDNAMDNKEAVEKLRQLIDEKYSYRDLRGVDWDKAFAVFGPIMERAKTPEQFAETAAKMFERAQDPHLWVKIGDKSIGGFRRNARRNFNMTTLRNVVPGFAERNKRISTGRFEDGIGYILINNWSKDGDNLEPAFSALKEFSDAPGLIVDVRPNSGGSEPLAEEFAGCFTDKPVLYSKHVYRKPGEPNSFGPEQDRILEPNKERGRYKGKVAVLMGQVNMSSCESFLLMMKQAGCKMIGERSYGSSGNPKPYELGNGVTVWLPSWKDLLPDGTCLEGRGVLPDIPVIATDAQLNSSDPVLDAALKYLRNK